jgi:hypothetical protein
MNGLQPADSHSRLVDAWWDALLAGPTDEPHPVYGDDLEVAIKHGILHLSGELPSEKDRKELLAQARGLVGHGIDRVNAKHLKASNRKDKPGILDQTLIAAFRNREMAEWARKYLVETRRIKPKQVEILDSGREGDLRNLLPEDFAGDVRRAFKAGEAVLVLGVDETEAFKVRKLLDEDTRSRWTVATPPAPPRAGPADV